MRPLDAQLVVVTAVLWIVAVVVPPPAQAQCQPQWFAGRGFPGVNGSINASTSWDPDGGGGEPAVVVVGGSFTIAGDGFANSVAAWTGTEWAPLGNGILGTVRTLTVFDDGGGPALYAGGFFTIAGGAPGNYIARWNGTSWSNVGTGMDGQVLALAVFDDELYAGGAFVHAGGQSRSFIARWNGAQWSSVGGGMDSWVQAMTVFDDGSGSALYAGGLFLLAGGVPARFAAKWNGQSWSDLDTGEVDGVINTLTTYDDGDGEALYAGGDFTFIGTEAFANFVARWNGSTWSGLGNGTTDSVLTMTVYDDGSGPQLVAGGRFTSAGIVSADRVASWDGTDWSALDVGLGNTVTTLSVVQDGAQASLYAGGVFSSTGSRAAAAVAKWDGATWSTLGAGQATNALIDALVPFDDGTGPALHAAGGFTTAGELVVNNTARWDTSAWSPLGAGTNFQVFDLAVFDDALVAGGWFTSAGGAPANFVARWDGATWSPLGAGTGYIVRSLAVFDDGDGAALYAGGSFTSAGGQSANFVARWDGASWSALSSGMNNIVYALAVFDDGTGAALYAGGEFTTAGGGAASYVAKWNGTAWSPLGSGMNGAVYTLTTFDDGGGPKLYAGGFFDQAGGQAADHIARWDGAGWSPVGTGMGGHAFPSVFAMTVFDDGNGAALYAGGQFTTAGGESANNIARWDGVDWSPLSTGLEGSSAPAVQALAVFDDGTGPSLYVGGTFHVAGGLVSGNFARWGNVPPSGSPTLTLADSGPSTQLSWTSLPGAGTYDLVRGNLAVLRSSGGNFTAATRQCLADDTTATSHVLAPSPGPGEGFWFLVRGANCTARGSYDSGASSQVGSRDSEIDASPVACP